MDTHNLATTLEAIDAVIATNKKATKKGEALRRLIKNQDFIDVVTEGYFDAESIRLFNILTDPSGANIDVAEDLHLQLESIRNFKRYIGTSEFTGEVEFNAESAPMNIHREEQYRKEVTAEFDTHGDN